MKWLINYLKQKFSLKKNSDLKNTDKSVSVEENIIDNIDWELISKLNKNDIVIVKMNAEKIENNNIAPDHQIRPFIIRSINKEKKMVSGLYLTGNINSDFYSNYNSCFKFVLSKDKYSLKKHSLVRIDNDDKIDFENISKYVDTLKIEDMSKIEKYFHLYHGKYILNTKDNNILEIGDIVSLYNQRYLIYATDNTCSYGYLITDIYDKVDVNKEDDRFLYNGNIYQIHYDSTHVFNNREEICIINRFNNEFVEKVRSNRKTIKYKNKIKKQ